LDLLYLNTRLVTTSNYSAIADLHILQITAANTKYFAARSVFTSRYLATASSSGDPSASRTQVLPSLTLVPNYLPAILSTKLDRHLFSIIYADLNCTQHYQTSALFLYNRFARTE
jgi:hypothetical protein